MSGIAGARQRVGAREGELAGDAGHGKRAGAIGQGRNGRVGCEHEPPVDRLDPVLSHEAREQRVVLVSTPEAGRADDLVGAVDGPLDSEAPLGRRPLDRLVEGARPPGRRARAAAGAARARCGEGRRWKDARPRFVRYWRGTFSGRRTGSRRRTEITVAPAASAFSHSVAAASPAPTTQTLSAYPCGS